MTAIDVKNFKRGAAFIPGAISIPDSRVVFMIIVLCIEYRKFGKTTIVYIVH